MAAGLPNPYASFHDSLPVLVFLKYNNARALQWSSLRLSTSFVEALLGLCRAISKAARYYIIEQRGFGFFVQ